MSKSSDRLRNDFWRSLTNNHRIDELNILKSYIFILLFLKHIKDNENVSKELKLTIPEGCDFGTIQEIADYDVSYIGHDIKIGEEINSRLDLIAKTNPLLEGVVNFVDFTNTNALGEGYDQNIVLGKIIRLIEDYEYDLKASNGLSNTTWIELFDFLNQSFVENIGRHSVGFPAPNELGVLIAKLFNSKKNTVNSLYDPVLGTGNLLFSTIQEIDNEVAVYGEEINFESVFLAKLKFLFHGFSNYNFQTNDVLKSPSFRKKEKNLEELFKPMLRKFDYIVSCPPFNVKNWCIDPTGDLFERWNSITGIPPKNNADFAYVLHILNSLKDNGTGVCVVSNGALFRSGAEREIRRYLVENGFIKGIISLPAKLFYNTSIPCSIIILGKQSNENNSGVFVIDASSEFEAQRFINKLSPENISHIADAWVNRTEDNKFSRLVSIDEIIENDFNLNIPRHLVSIEEFNVSKDSKVVELAELLNTVPRTRTVNETGLLIKISDLASDQFVFEIDLHVLTLSEVTKSFIKLETPSLLLSKRFNKLKPSFCKASKELPVFIAPEIEAYTLKENCIDLSYLVLQLNSEYVTKQLESLSNGGIMPNIKKDDILKLKITVPSLEKQDSLIAQKALAEGARIQSDKNKIESLQLQSTIDTLLKERMNDFQWKLHDIRNGELLNLKGQIVTLEMFAEANPQIFSTVIDDNSNATLLTSVKDLYTSVQSLALILADLYDTSNTVGEKEDIGLLEFIANFCENQLKLNKGLFDINYSVIDKLKQDYDTQDFIISFNKKDLQAIFTNIFENAIRHGGFEETSQSNQIKFDLVVDSKKETIAIAILNNGRISNITEIDFFADGGKAGTTGNSGKGGHIIKILTERNQGKVFQKNYTAEEAFGYTFEVGIELKYKLHYGI
jgi:type I restriction system adenine methylase HsdM